MNRSLRDLIQSTKTPGVLVAIAVLLLGGAVVSEIFVAAQPARGVQYSVVVEYNTGSGYHLTFFVFDNSGRAYTDASIDVIVHGPGAPGPILENGTKRTDAKGFAVFSWSGPEGSALNGSNDNFDLKISTPSGSVQTVSSLPTPDPGAPLGFGTVHLIDVGDFVVIPYLQASFGNASGYVPPGTRLVYNYPAVTGNGTVFGTVGNVTSNPEQFRLTLPAAAMNGGGVTVSVSILNATGAELDYNEFGSTEFLVESGSQTPEGAALASAATYLSLLIPLGAVIVAESAYGRDRLSGALDPLLALPLTRVRVLLQRYLSSILILGAASTAALAEFEWQAAVHTIAVPSALLAGLWVSTVFEGVVFLGLMLLLSHIVRSQGTLMASGIGLVVVFGAVWGLLVLLAATYAGLPRQVYSQTVWLAHVGFVNPVSIGQGLLALSLWQLSPSSALMFPAVTNLVVETGVAVAWLSLPILGAVLLAKYRD